VTTTVKGWEVIRDAAVTSRVGSRRLLVVSYLFAPNPAVGGLRWEKFAGHFAEQGWDLDVITLHPRHLHSLDNARLAALPEGIRVIGLHQRVPIVERTEEWALGMKRRLAPGAASARSSTGSSSDESQPRMPRPESFGREQILRVAAGSGGPQRMYHAWLDFARLEPWARDAAEAGVELFDPLIHGAVISCGPPHQTHKAALAISKRCSLPFVADLRDPLALVERLPAHIASPTWFRIAQGLERRILSGADLVVMNTEPAREAMAARHRESSAKIVCVMNGTDEEAVPNLPRPRFVAAYAGSIYLDRDPTPFFRAAARVIRDLDLSPQSFSIEFVGNVASYSGVRLSQIAEEGGVGPYVRLWESKPRDEVLNFLAQASLLLSLPQDSELAIPSKVFDYMQFDATLLALAEPESATARLLAGTRARCASPNDIDGIAAVLSQSYRDYVAGIRPQALGAEDRFTRRYQAQHLLQRINNLVLVRGRNGQ
jgi:hypothetical protein